MVEGGRRERGGYRNTHKYIQKRTHPAAPGKMEDGVETAERTSSLLHHHSWKEVSFLIVWLKYGSQWEYTSSTTRLCHSGVLLLGSVFTVLSPLGLLTLWEVATQKDNGALEETTLWDSERMKRNTGCMYEVLCRADARPPTLDEMNETALTETQLLAGAQSWQGEPSQALCGIWLPFLCISSCDAESEWKRMQTACPDTDAAGWCSHLHLSGEVRVVLSKQELATGNHGQGVRHLSYFQIRPFLNFNLFVIIVALLRWRKLYSEKWNEKCICLFPTLAETPLHKHSPDYISWNSIWKNTEILYCIYCTI